MPIRPLALAHLDFDPPSTQPPAWRVGLATLVALVASVLANMALAALGKAVSPSTQHFSHFRFDDYATLTAIGAVVACAAWPVVTRVSSTPRWLFFRLAVAVTVVLWLPDIWILLRGETAAGVAVLMVMHLAVALVTYNSLVHLAPVVTSPAPLSRETAPRSPAPEAVTPSEVPRGTRGTGALERRGIWALMVALVSVELLLGIVTLVSVPAGRPTGLVPHRGAAVYVVHVLVGFLLGIGAAALLTAARRYDREIRLGAGVGFAGVVLGGLGGIAVSDHELRLVGMGVMFVGVGLAAMGYLVPALVSPIDRGPRRAPRQVVLAQARAAQLEPGWAVRPRRSAKVTTNGKVAQPRHPPGGASRAP